MKLKTIVFRTTFLEMKNAAELVLQWINENEKDLRKKETLDQFRVTISKIKPQRSERDRQEFIRFMEGLE